ncbi:MAG: 1-deoxy-D-xylulose-5-phosphate synthase [Oscillospiraceae bacterium]|nr:1-deoxy-D-xylulose-5-phosphate synthase [Oscillospiraceae bacterium]
MPVCILESIHGHEDLVKLDEKQRKQLCAEIREFLISRVSQTGGHVASNLGVVELTVALETVFNTKNDRLVFDVGHQSYIHKLLTDRQADFYKLRQYGGMAGFPKPSESQTDAFVAGHASSSVSIALGMARARTLMGEKYHVVSLLGDGAATGGMAYEGLNDAAVSGEPLIVILNDNAMSIDHNVGGMASHLRKLRTKERYLGMKENYRKVMNAIPGGKFVFRFTRAIKDRLRRMLIPMTIFESMGFTYLGPVDGHDTEHLIMLLRTAKELKRPVVLHVLTQKGRGYEPAQKHPKLFHGIGKFDPETGIPCAKSRHTFSDTLGETLCRIAETEKRLCAITAAMPGGTGLLDFKEKYAQRFFDVGIAEEHAVSMAGGLAKQGMIPVVALYSTFLQRAYDMILQDICMLGLHVVFAVDRAGLVGEDGETHHGVFDVGFLRHAPNMLILSPASQNEFGQMMQWAITQYNGPVAIRYPRGADRSYTESAWKNDPEDSLAVHTEGKDAAIITYGTMLQNAMDAAALLQTEGKNITVIRLMNLSKQPVDALKEKLSGISRVFIAEEMAANCGVSHALAYSLQDKNIYGLNLGDQYVPHGSVDQLYAHCGLDSRAIADRILEVLDHEN